MGRRRFNLPDNLTIVFKQEPNDEPDTQSGQDAAQGSETLEEPDEDERW